MATYMGDNIEDFKVGNLLGKGSFAGVYRAKSIHTGLEVAIKMIDKKAMHKAKMVQRVQNEVRIHCQLKHPSILELYNYFEDSNYVYLILELCHNGEMNRYLKNRMKPFTEKEVRHFMHQIVRGLLYLHSHGILHRDLTLSNLLLTGAMNVKIADFGLATQLALPHEKHYTLCGTPNYISPEVATRSAHGPAADVWALGCLLYTLLVGRPPFDTDSVRATLGRVVLADYRLPAALSAEARDLIGRLLRRDPAARPGLAALLDHPFLAGGPPPGDAGDSLDSGHATLSTTAAAGSSGVSLSGCSLGRRRLLLAGPPLPDRMTFRPAGIFSSSSSSADGRHDRRGGGGTGERPHSRYLRRARSSDRSTPARPGAGPRAAERWHSLEELSGVGERGGQGSPAGSAHREDDDDDAAVLRLFGELDVGSRGSREAPGGDRGRSRQPHTRPAAFPGPDGPDRSETVQQWFGNLKAEAGRLREEPPTEPPAASRECQCPPAPGGSGPAPRPQRDPRAAGRDQRPGPAREGRTPRGVAAPLDAHRLKPIRQKTRRAVVSILDTEEVCVELLKEQVSQEHVKEVLRVSSDGRKVTVYQPNAGRGSVLGPRPPPLPAPADLAQYSFDGLPEKYWRKYEYAARFIQLVRSKTPKVTLFTRHAKCVLMENAPSPDFEVWFYDGTKIREAEGSTQMTEPSGRSWVFRGESEAVRPEPEARVYMDHADEGRRICLALESLLSEQEKRSGGCGVPFFPIVVGRKPSQLESLKTQPSGPGRSPQCSAGGDGVTSLSQGPGGGGGGPVAAANEGSGSAAGAPAAPATAASASWQASRDCPPPSAQLLKSVFVQDVGWASQLASGAVWVQFNDGSQLVVQPGVPSVVYTAPGGQVTRYGEHDKLPGPIKEKLQCLSSILLTFASQAGPR
ncbi:serine/threonine-protein kinase PLK4 [Tachyglossus aculeatus]|uniref:serine/threonine-protein kinase PLK4 n=1 Tax=Tachyglossus aculeatus TaxID=9261 RepID=UPI0018F61285|nr:serine/threonine-protein kinase PLK4 [Tachyglossus aculeatus]